MSIVLTDKNLTAKIISLYTSPLRVKLAGEPDASGEVKNALHAQPDGLDSGLTITRSRKKTAKPGDQAHHLIERGRFVRQLLLVQDVGSLPLVRFEHQLRIQV